MPQIDRGADLIVVSRSQTEEQMRQALTGEGYSDITTEVVTQGVQPDPGEVPPVAPTAEEAPVVPVEDPSPVTDPAPPAEPVVVPPVDPPAEPEARRAPRNSRERKIVRLEEQLKLEKEAREKQAADIADLRAKFNAAPTATVPPKTEDPKPAEPVAPPAPVVPAGPDPDETPLVKPKRTDFFEAEDPDEAYTDALIDYKDNERQRQQRVAEKAKVRQEAESKVQEEARKRKEVDDSRKAEESKVADEYKASLDAARVKYSDWDAVLQTPGELCSPAMGHAVRTSANAEILYWLGKHPEEASRICRETKLPEKSTQAQVERVMRIVYREFDKIEADIQASQSAAQRAQENPPDEDIDEDEDEPVVTPAVAPAAPAAPKVTPPPAPPVPVATPAPAPVPPSPAPTPAVKPKFTPVAPLGGRGGTVTKPLSEMTAEEIRNISPSEYRKLRGA